MKAAFHIIVGAIVLSLSAILAHAQAERSLEEENLQEYLTRMGLGCVSESGQVRLKLPNPCPFEKRLARKLSFLSTERSVVGYLRNNAFQCKEKRAYWNCAYSWTYIQSPIVNGVRLNPDIKNDFELTIHMPAASRPLAADEIKVRLRREEGSALEDPSMFATATAPSFTTLVPVMDNPPSEKLEEIGRALHQDLMATYEAFKARQKGIFNEEISTVVEKRINNGALFDVAGAILQAAGFEPLKVSRVQDGLPNTETYFSNLVLLRGFSASIIVNVLITFKSINRVLEVDRIDARMVAHYL
jgi:hypothetical protein